MKAVIIPYAYMDKCEWARKAFPDRSIASLPVAGKHLICYQLDECAKKGVSEVLILDWGYDARLATELGDGSKWGLSLSYIGATAGGSLKSQISRHSNFLEKGNTDFILENSVGGRPIDSLQHYFEANFDVLANPGELSLPGYSAEEGVHAGMNVVMKPGVEVASPVLLGDNSRLERGVSVSGGAVIGNGAVIDRGTRIEHSIVFSGTYVGRDMEIVDKIVYGRRILSPKDGVFVDADDSGVAASLDAFGDARPMPVPFENLVRHRYTAAGDAETDRRVANALSELALDVAALRLSKVKGVYLGGGYGRGEGGVPLYNDLDFFVLTDNATDSEKDEIKMQLDIASIRYHDELGVDVDFCRPKNASDFKKDERRLMMQELVRGNVAIFGEQGALDAIIRRHDASSLSVTEALRLLVNRGMGLAFARNSRDVEFVKRNANKAILGAGDAVLIAEGRYHWNCRARANMLANKEYSKAVEFKFNPTLEAPRWEEAYASWLRGLARVMELKGKSIRSRGPRHLARWLVRRRTIGDAATLGCDPLYRILVPLAKLLEKGRGGPEMPEVLTRDWMVFN